MAQKPFFAAILDFTTKQEVVCRVEANRTSYQLVILKRHLVQIFKFLCDFVLSTDSFKVNKGYIAKNYNKVKNSDR